VPINGKDPAKIARRGVCFIPERDKVFRGLSVADNLRLFAERRRHRDGLEADLALVHEIFPILHDRTRQLAGYLSGGEQQMLALSGVILARPDVLIVDEPSLGLAPVIIQNVMRRSGHAPRRPRTGGAPRGPERPSDVPLADHVYQ
jgi:branched-chain amino acid transport system ATP-binding protein